MAASVWKYVVWERLNKTGKWCPYSAEVSQLLEQEFLKQADKVNLGDADDNLKIYYVDLKDMIQVSETTGTKSPIKRHLCDSISNFCSGFIWQWRDGQDVWHPYDVEVNEFIEKARMQGLKSVALKKTFRGYNYEIDFVKMLQINKQTKRKRPIERRQLSAPYPIVYESTTQQNDSMSPTNMDKIEFPNLAQEVPGTSALMVQANQYIQNVQRTYNIPENGASNFVYSTDESMVMPSAPSADTICGGGDQIMNSLSLTSASENKTALVNGHPWYDSRPPHTSHEKIKPVPGIDPLPKWTKKHKKKKGRLSTDSPTTNASSVLEEYTVEIKQKVSTDSDEEEDCIICFEPLSEGSSYDGDTTLLKMKFCPHVFHKSCITSMYNSGPQDQSLQCPVCKKIHGIKLGIQPPGEMIYHVLPYSLPGYPDNDTIRIIYDIPSGTQGPEHPNPGKKYTARGFPRHCYLPDNEIGRKILRLLVKAWKRRLIFTIGRSTTTGEENTVVWNEIHHKTEFGCNRRGHGYPDPNHFDNILSELKAHGIEDDEVPIWSPA